MGQSFIADSNDKNSALGINSSSFCLDFIEVTKCCQSNKDDLVLIEYLSDALMGAEQ